MCPTIINFEKSGYSPSISLVVPYYQEGDTPIADNNDFTNDNNAAIMLQAKWALFNGFKTRSNGARAVYMRNCLSVILAYWVAGIARLRCKNRSVHGKNQLF
nr:TolC family protein [uncultured Desulfobacter sp.]